MKHNGRTADPFQEWEILTVEEAFKRYANVNLWADDLKAEAEANGVPCGENDTWEDVFFRIMLNKVEDHLGDGKPTILCEYPTQLGALARKKPDDPKVCERFEAYVCGVELCNAFSELTDAKEQAQRFRYDQQMQKKLYGTCVPIDTDFLQALEQGMPACAGNAVGVDRLIMLLTGQSDIHSVLWVPKL